MSVSSSMPKLGYVRFGLRETALGQVGHEEKRPVGLIRKEYEDMSETPSLPEVDLKKIDHAQEIRDNEVRFVNKVKLFFQALVSKKRFWMPAVATTVTLLSLAVAKGGLVALGAGAAAGPAGWAAIAIGVAATVLAILAYSAYKSYQEDKKQMHGKDGLLLEAEKIMKWSEERDLAQKKLQIAQKNLQVAVNDAEVDEGSFGEKLSNLWPFESEAKKVLKKAKEVGMSLLSSSLREQPTSLEKIEKAEKEIEEALNGAGDYQIIVAKIKSAVDELKQANKELEKANEGEKTESHKLDDGSEKETLTENLIK